MEPLKTIKKKQKRSPTNETTTRILNSLLRYGVFAWRNNTVGIPIHRDGQIVGFRPSAKVGVSDIIGVYPCLGKGLFLSIEVKTGKDRLRPEQEGFIQTINKLGGVALVVKDYEDFEKQWEKMKQKKN